MRTTLPVLIACVLSAASLPGAAQELPARLAGLGSYSRPIDTRQPQAQAWFDQGLALLYAFNHYEALRAFGAAAALDSTAAMPHVGRALGFAPYLDRGRSASNDRAARTALAAAQARARDARERRLIDALLVRFDSTLSAARADTQYVAALRAMHAAEPADADIAYLLAEALMLRRQRVYWSGHDVPLEGVAEAHATLAAAMESKPAHLGVNHLFVHLYEAAHDAAPALGAAERLRDAAPGLGHLQHMGAHVYFRIGRYQDAVLANERAWAADRRYFAAAQPPASSVYASAYHLHTLHFLWMAHAMQGDRVQALRVADSLAARVSDASANASPYSHPWVAAPLLVHTRFADWNAVLAMPAPAQERAYARGLWHHARALALAATGRVEDAARELEALASLTDAVPAAARVAPTAPGRSMLRLAHSAAAARVAEVTDRTDDAVRLLEDAIALQDSLGHMEPPGWYVPLRQSLGALLLRSGRLADAERAFRADLAHYPANGWSLSGLAGAVRGQGREAEDVERALERAWPASAPREWWRR